MFRTRTFLSNGGLGAFGLIVIAFCYFTATQFELYASVNPCRGGNSHSPDPFPALGFIFVLGLLLSVYFRLYHSRPRSVEYLLLAFLLGLFVFRSFIPAWQSLNTDFRNYYVAARLFRKSPQCFGSTTSPGFSARKIIKVFSSASWVMFLTRCFQPCP